MNILNFTERMLIIFCLILINYMLYKSTEFKKKIIKQIKPVNNFT